MSAKQTIASSLAHLAVRRPHSSVILTLARESLRSCLQTNPYRPSLHLRLCEHHVALSTSSHQAPGDRCPVCLADPRSSSPHDLLPTAAAICHNCASFLPVPASGSHFSLFGLPQAYRLNRSALRQQYHRWQQLVHPDLAAGRQNQTKSPTFALPIQSQNLQASLAQQWSITVNHARAILESDIKRAAYILQLDGRLAMPDESGDSCVDPDLLMTMMEIHERLEDAKSEKEVEEIRAENREIMQEAVAALERLWTSDRPLDIVELERARKLAVRLRYLDTIDRTCREWRPPAT